MSATQGLGPLRRGSVVLRGRCYNLVWDARGPELVVLPILRPRHPDGADVALDLAELLAGTIPIADPVVRPAGARREPRSGLHHVGELPGPAMCRVVRGVIRATQNAATHRFDAATRRQRAHLADDRCVNLVA
jgi:hypothetical protein